MGQVSRCVFGPVVGPSAPSEATRIRGGESRASSQGRAHQTGQHDDQSHLRSKHDAFSVGAFRGGTPAVLPAVIINRVGVMDAVERAIVSDATSQSTIRSNERVHCGGWLAARGRASGCTAISGWRPDLGKRRGYPSTIRYWKSAGFARRWHTPSTFNGAGAR